MSTRPARTDAARSAGDGDELLRQLRLIYGRREVARDAFGRRTALPSEIARAIGRRRRT